MPNSAELMPNSADPVRQRPSAMSRRVPSDSEPASRRDGSLFSRIIAELLHRLGWHGLVCRELAPAIASEAPPDEFEPDDFAPGHRFATPV